MENFLEPLAFPLIIAKNRDFPALRQPVPQVIEKKIAPGFLKDEIAARRMQKIMREEHQVIAGSFLGGPGYLLPGRAKRAGSDLVTLFADFLLRPQIHRDKTVRQIIAQRRFRVFAPIRSGQAQLGGLEMLHRTLRIDVELPQRNQLLVLPLRPQGTRRIPRKNIDHRPAHAELPPPLHLRLARVTGLLQLPQKPLPVQTGILHQLEPVFPERLGPGQRLPRRPRRGQHHALETVSQSPQRRQPFRGNFRIGQRLRRRRFHLRKEKVRRVPRLQIVGQFLLGLHSRRQRQKGPARCVARQPGQDKRLGRRGQMAQGEGRAREIL